MYFQDPTRFNPLIQGCSSQILILWLAIMTSIACVCTEKIIIDLFSVYPEISFDNDKSEKITEIS